MSDQSASADIDKIIKGLDGWKASSLHQLRQIIQQADPSITETIKWRTPSRPEGLPVWMSGGIVCFAEVWTDNIKLIFPKGKELEQSAKLFNARLKSTTTRAVEYRQDSVIDADSLTSLIIKAVELNLKLARK